MKLNDIAKKMIFVLCILLAVITVGSAIYYRSLAFLPFATGALLVVALNIVKIVMLDHAVDKALTMTEGKSAGNYMRVQYFLRFILTGAVLVFAATSPYINLWGAVAGVFTMPVAAYSMKIFYGNDVNQITQ